MSRALRVRRRHLWCSSGVRRCAVWTAVVVVGGGRRLSEAGAGAVSTAPHPAPGGAVVVTLQVVAEAHLAGDFQRTAGTVPV